MDIPDSIKNRLDIQPVKWIEQVLDAALERKPEALPDDEPETTKSSSAQEGATPAVIKH